MKNRFKNQFKVLRLPYWIINQNLFLEEDIISEFKNEKEIYPIFKRNGYYFDRYNNMTWVEYDGWAKTYKDNKEFLHDLQLNYEAGPQIENYKFDLLNKLLKTKYKNKQVLKEVKLEIHRRDIIQAGRDSRKYFIKYMKGQENGKEIY